jgi:LAO/AO transport system kinase
MPKKEQVDDWLRKRKDRRLHQTANELFPLLKIGNRQALSSAITLIESNLAENKKEARELLLKCLEQPQNSWRIGITGVPGVGKSTFIEEFGRIILEKGLKLAVLAIDPSSSISGGSILGDKTRMEWLSVQDNVFIRPTPSGLNLGGVAKHTRESILLCEAAGYDVILIETVGVGQSETVVHSIVDFFLLLMLAGAGDDLQGIKRGIMEMADALVITKADGENILKAKQARAQYASAMHLFPPKENNWIVPALISSSVEQKGLDEVWSTISSFFTRYASNGWIAKNRSQQEIQIMNSYLGELWLEKIRQHPKYNDNLNRLSHLVLNGKINGYLAAEELLSILLEN